MRDVEDREGENVVLWFDRGFETGLGYYLNENASHVVNKYCSYSF